MKIRDYIANSPLPVRRETPECQMTDEQRYWQRVIQSAPPVQKFETPGAKSCQTCRGIGYVRVNVPLGDPRFGKLLPCVCQSDAIARANDARRAKMAVGLFAPRMDGLNVDDLLATGGAGTVAMVAVAKQILRRETTHAVIWGNNGVGKTECLHAIARAWRGDSICVTLARLLEWLRAGFDGGDYDSRIEQLRTVHLLCVDEFTPPTDMTDFRRVKMSDWARETISDLFDERYRAARRVDSPLVTAYTTNQNPRNWERYYYDRSLTGISAGYKSFAIVHNADNSARGQYE